MSGILTWENFNSLNYSSDSSVDSIDKTEDLVVLDKLNFLKSQIGEDLFSQLFFEDQFFMSSIIGSVDLGHSIDFSDLSDFINDYEDY